MKQTIVLNSWKIKQCGSLAQPGQEDTPVLVKKYAGEWIEIGGIMEVQEALIQKGLLSGSIIEDADAEYCQWINENDWAYQCTFREPAATEKNIALEFKGLDTVADIYLNGVFLGTANTMYKSFRFKVGELLKEENELLVYFHAHEKMLKLYEETMPAEWKGHVPARALLHKSDDYAATFGYKPVGLFDDVLLEITDETRLDETDLNVSFSPDRSSASAAFCAGGPVCGGTVEVEFSIEEESGANRQAVKVKAEMGKNGWSAKSVLTVENPRLWWPKGCGDQNLYRISYAVYVGGVKRDEVVKLTGLRDVRLVGSMKFEINGTVIRFWGSNLAPIWGLTNRYNSEVVLDLIRKADYGNCNILRIWGPSQPYKDELYTECDRRGIMLWQDFPTGGSEMPDSKEQQALYLEEAAQMIRRLKHHPSIMLWCGGNENIYMSEYLEDKTSRIGFEMLIYGFKKLCMELDPYRYYHISCPYEGLTTNDHSFGDAHGSRAFLSYFPYEQYPNFLSETIRVYPLQYKSLKKFMKDEIWEEGYVDYRPFGTEFPMPSGWAKRLGNFGQKKLGPIDNYYSARNPYELIYKFTAAAGQDIYDMISRCRHGNPAWKSWEERACNGFMSWKFNDPWPQFYCASVDYYGECALTYYWIKRAFSPVLVDFEVGDHIYLWGANDTPEDSAGFLEVKVYDLKNAVVKQEFSIPAAIPAGESRILTTLDRLGSIRWDSVLYACYKDKDGEVISSATGYVTKENMLPFPKAELSLSYSSGCLTITTDQFARCVELSGGEDGEEFGWYFEDNYFDLMPFETKRIMVYGKNSAGVISAKAHYSDKVTRISVEGVPELR